MNLLKEYESVELGDKRLDKRLRNIVGAVRVAPDKHFPQLMDEAELGAFYDFVQNEKVTPGKILSSHQEKTVERSSKVETLLIAHDTSEFGYTTPREGMGRINDKGQGFFAHYSLAIGLSADGELRKPLGVLNLQTHVRKNKAAGKKIKHTEKKPWEEKESIRWRDGILKAEKQLEGKASGIHLLDREGDSYELEATLKEAGLRFIIRCNHDRRVAGGKKLSEELTGFSLRAKRKVFISAREGDARGRIRKAHPKRVEREASLEISAGEVVLLSPKLLNQKLPESLRINVVHVREVNAPKDCAPIDWKLYTLEPIKTKKEIEAIVDAYRSRWLIEELFKALKTGCSMEKRQLESFKTMLNALAIVTPMAVELLILRYLSRDTPSAKAIEALRPELIPLIMAKLKLETLSTAQDAALAVARLGGHLKRNGPPGWIVLGRGYQRLLSLEEGFLLAKKM